MEFPCLEIAWLHNACVWRELLGVRGCRTGVRRRFGFEGLVRVGVCLRARPIVQVDRVGFCGCWGWCGYGSGRLPASYLDRVSAVGPSESAFQVVHPQAGGPTAGRWSIRGRLSGQQPHRRQDPEGQGLKTLETGLPDTLEELKSAGQTLNQRRKDILAYFDHPGIFNGPTEAVNAPPGTLTRHRPGLAEPDQLHHPRPHPRRRLPQPAATPSNLKSRFGGAGAGRRDRYPVSQRRTGVACAAERGSVTQGCTLRFSRGYRPGVCLCVTGVDRRDAPHPQPAVHQETECSVRSSRRSRRRI
ncbi:transposase [Actinomyces qiguomingii]|uniref:transposase n=1 Tax=Actinomyces qiguomingii TaxID=2057800 RepID=UPI000FFE67AC